MKYGNYKLSGCRVFSLPVPETCKGGGACRKYCYGLKGRYRMRNVRAALERAYRFTLRKEFVQSMINELKHARKVYRVRVHEVGDFYSLRYLQKWYAIAQACPRFTFLAYTKSLHFVSEGVCPPSNFIILASLGGKYDNLASELEAKGYIRGLTVVVPDISQAPEGWFICPATIPGLEHRKVCGRLCDYCWRPQRGKRVVFIQH